VRRSLLAALCLLVATSAWGQSSETYTRHRRGTTTAFDQVDCTTGGSDVVVDDDLDGSGDYDRLSIIIKNCDPSGGSNVAICPGDATCSATEGLILEPGTGLWIDWSNSGPIGCIGIGGTATTCFIEERG
jgi:hypothetical protein